MGRALGFVFLFGFAECKKRTKSKSSSTAIIIISGRASRVHKIRRTEIIHALGQVKWLVAPVLVLVLCWCRREKWVFTLCKSIHRQIKECNEHFTYGHLCRHPAFLRPALSNEPAAKFRFVVSPSLRSVRFSYSTAMVEIRKSFIPDSTLPPHQPMYLQCLPFAQCIVWNTKENERREEKEEFVSKLDAARRWPLHVHAVARRVKNCFSQRSTNEPTSSLFTDRHQTYTYLQFLHINEFTSVQSLNQI